MEAADLKKFSEQLNSDCPKHKFEVIRKWSIRRGRVLKVKVDGVLKNHVAVDEKYFGKNGPLQKFHKLDPYKELSDLVLFELQCEDVIEVTDPRAVEFREALKR